MNKWPRAKQFKYKKTVLIIGNGSIGRRHAGNLKNMNYLIQTVDIDEINNIDNIIKMAQSSPNPIAFGMVCSPTNLHLKHCLKLAEYKIPYFCEKPFYKDLTYEESIDLQTLEAYTEGYDLINMVACNLRFHETIEKITPEKLKSFKKMKVYFGYDLKKWHGDGKHLEMYSANRNMGGGVVFDCIHEFDYLQNWYGHIKNIKLNIEKRNNVTVDTEDYADGYIEFGNEKTGEVIHTVHFILNYLDDEYTRYFKVKYFDGKKEKFNITPDNKMYIKEMNYFTDCIDNHIHTNNDIFKAKKLVDILRDKLIYDF